MSVSISATGAAGSSLGQGENVRVGSWKRDGSGKIYGTQPAASIWDCGGAQCESSIKIITMPTDTDQDGIDVYVGLSDPQHGYLATLNRFGGLLLGKVNAGSAEGMYPWGAAPVQTPGGAVQAGDILHMKVEGGTGSRTVTASITRGGAKTQLLQKVDTSLPITGTWGGIAASSASLRLGDLQFQDLSGGSGPTTLAAPTGLTANAASSSRVNLSWNAVAGATGYKLKVDGTDVDVPATPTPAPAPAMWTAASPINSLIPANPVLDANSAAIIAALNAGAVKQLLLGEYGVAVYQASADTPTWTNIVPSNFPAWGANPFAGEAVPVDMSWNVSPAATTDGHIVIISADGTKQWSMWKADLSGAAPTCAWGEVAQPTTATITSAKGNSTGAAFSRGAGVVTVAEMEAGVIPHALVFSTDIAKPTTFRFPATKTDGSNMRGVAANATLEEGARIQLDPAYDVAGSSLRPYEKILATAAQKYGAYGIDNGGAAVGILMERPHGTYANTVGTPTGHVPSAYGYWSRGIDKDYKSLALPWGSFRVLKKWDGSA